MNRLIAGFVLMLGCLPPPPTQEPPPPGNPNPDVVIDDLGNGSVTSPPETEARPPKRMTVMQVRRSMEAISGGEEWLGGRNGTENNWERFSGTLGVPDYQEVTTGDLSPSLMWNKFLTDAATATCDGWVNREVNGTGTGTFFQAATVDTEDQGAIRDNIAQLRKRIQGHDDPGSADAIDSYYRLYEAVRMDTSNRRFAWRTVCVALFVHPDFYGL